MFFGLDKAAQCSARLFTSFESATSITNLPSVLIRKHMAGQSFPTVRMIAQASGSDVAATTMGDQMLFPDNCFPVREIAKDDLDVRLNAGRQHAV